MMTRHTGHTYLIITRYNFLLPNGSPFFVISSSIQPVLQTHPIRTQVPNARIGIRTLFVRKSKKLRISIFNTVKPDQIPNPNEDGIPINKLNAPKTIIALTRENFHLSINMETVVSKIEIELVTAAMNTSTKNSAPITWPPGICPNTFGSVINMRPGPPLFKPSSPLNTNTAGMIIKPAINAMAVSKISIWFTDLERFTSSFT